MFRSSSTYLYIAVFLGLFCYVTFIDKKVQTTKAHDEAETKLFDFNPEDAVVLEITNPHGLFIFQKIDGHWEIRKPVETPADGAAIDGVLNQIAFTQPQRLIGIDGDSAQDADNLKKWGLSPPAERVVIHTLKKQYVLLLGRKIPINDSIYARGSERKNEPVRIISSQVKDVVDKDLSAFRSRNVFDFDAQKVTQISTHVTETTPAATTPGPQCEIDLKDGRWVMQLPVVARASTSGVQALIGKISGLHAVDFIVDDASNLSTYGLTSPTAALSITASGSEPMALEIGGPVPGKPDQVYAQRLKSNSVFTLAKNDVDDLLKAVPNVRDRHILPFDPNKALGLSYSIGTRKVGLRSNKSLWNTVGAAEGSADVGKAVDLLAKLSLLETTPAMNDSVTDLKPFGLDKPQGKITIESPEFKPGGTLTLLVGKNENKLLYVRNSTEPFIYTVAENAFDFLPANNLALRDTRVINLKRDQVKTMTITVGTMTPLALSRSPGGTWTATNVKDRMVDGLKADGQVSLVCQLQAKAWLGSALPAYGLSKPVLSIAVEADKAVVLHIGAPLPDGSHAAQVEGDPTAFALADGDFGILSSSSLQPIPNVLAPTNAPTTVPPPAQTNAPAK